MIDQPEPPSPCTGVCAIGADGLCAGCLRTLGEIAAWSAASAADKRAVLAAVASRTTASPLRSA